MRIAYPKALRKFIAEADLCREQGQMSVTEHAALIEKAVGDHEAAFAEDPRFVDFANLFERDSAQQVWVRKAREVAMPTLPTVRNASGRVVEAVGDGLAGIQA